jgi:hypothetical protein
MDVTPTDLEEIKRLKARYFRYVDTKNWAALRALYVDDAVFDGFDYATDTPDQFVAGVAAYLATTSSVHQGFMPELVPRGSDLVRGIWAMHDYLVWEPGTRGYKGMSTPDQWGIEGYGHYEEEYRRTAGGWRISFQRLTRLRIDPLTGPPASVGLQHPVLQATADWLD